MPEPDSEVRDGVLIGAVLAGDQDQFEALVRRYQAPLIRVASSRLGRADWAEDVVQETMLCAFKSLRTYDSRYSFRTWLWTILLNQCRRHLKKRTRGLLVRLWGDQGSEPGIEEIANQLRTEECPSNRLVARERSELLDTLLLRLPEAQADALRLRFYGELKFTEIAAAMGCSLSTAKNRVRWGLEKMAAFIDADGVATTAALMESDV